MDYIQKAIDMVYEDMIIKVQRDRGNQSRIDTFRSSIPWTMNVIFRRVHAENNLWKLDTMMRWEVYFLARAVGV